MITPTLKNYMENHIRHELGTVVSIGCMGVTSG